MWLYTGYATFSLHADLLSPNGDAPRLSITWSTNVEWVALGAGQCGIRPFFRAVCPYTILPTYRAYNPLLRKHLCTSKNFTHSTIVMLICQTVRSVLRVTVDRKQLSFSELNAEGSWGHVNAVMCTCLERMTADEMDRLCSWDVRTGHARNPLRHLALPVCTSSRFPCDMPSYCLALVIPISLSR